jgi:hypothetical protein
MIDFTAVSREVRSLVSRRRELLTFLGSVFAALGIFLQNALKGELPQVLAGLEQHLFTTYAFMLMVPSLVLALRLARLHAGLALNGTLYARLMQEQSFTTVPPPGAVERAGRHNFAGLSFLTFLLATFLAGFSASLMALALQAPVWLAPVVGAGVMVLWLGLYFYYHERAVGFARQKARTDSCLPFGREQWEGHVAGSLEDTNHDMIAVLAVVGLIVFSAFESLSGLGAAKGEDNKDLPAAYVQQYGVPVYGGLMAVTCLVGLAIYIRLRVAVGTLSLEIDPTDRPFRPLRLTDSLLGYLLVAFLFVVSVHFLLFESFKGRFWTLVGVDAVVFALTVAAEQLTLVVMGRRYHSAKK